MVHEFKHSSKIWGKPFINVSKDSSKEFTKSTSNSGHLVSTFGNVLSLNYHSPGKTFPLVPTSPLPLTSITVLNGNNY